MEASFYVLIGLLVAAVGVIVWLLRRQKEAPAPGNDQGLLLIQSQLAEQARAISEFGRLMDGKLTESSRWMQDSLRSQFSESTKIIREITSELARVGEGQKQVMNFTEQLRDLQDILKNPKQRGILGEYYLETLLKNVLPPGSFQMQYPFPDGTIVDAAVFVRDKIIPVDSKFSLENYNRLVAEREPAERERLEKLFVSDLKLRIQETAKYIQPERGTLEFAFMFIPHEAIYYDLLVNTVGALKDDTENLIQRAASKYHVIIVSPTSFLAYLQTVLQGLNAMKIEEKAQEIVKRVAELGKHLKAYEEYHLKLGNSLGTVVNHFNNGSKELKKIDKDVMRISGAAPGLALELVDAPQREE